MIIWHKLENVNTFFEKNFKTEKKILIFYEISWKNYEIRDKIIKDVGEKNLILYIKGRIHMENEITFRTSVGGYRRDEVIEYVESMNEQIFCLKKESEEAAANYKARIHELETLLAQKETDEAALIEEKGAKLEEYETENAKLKEQYQAAHSDVARLEAEKRVLKEKLGREVLRLRTENQELKEKLQEAERNIGSEADYEGVRDAVSEVQYKIAEYVNIINKTQQSLGETYQKMNGIKKKVAERMEQNRK